MKTVFLLFLVGLHSQTVVVLSNGRPGVVSEQEVFESKEDCQKALEKIPKGMAGVCLEGREPL